MPIGVVIGSVVGGIAQASAARKAASAQSKAAKNDIAFQKETRDIIRGDLAPYRETGKNALAAYAYELGLGPNPSTPENPYGGFTATPGYQFRFNQGTEAVNALAGAGGGLDSGATREALTRFGQGIASDEYGQYLARLGGFADAGLSAANMSGQASQFAAAGTSAALAARGNAQSAGAIGVGNALNQGIGNVLGAWQYQQGLQQPYNQATGTGSWWLGTR